MRFIIENIFNSPSNNKMIKTSNNMFFLLTFIKSSFVECKMSNLVLVEMFDIDGELNR
jgi:hypothetical protein